MGFTESSQTIMGYLELLDSFNDYNFIFCFNPNLNPKEWGPGGGGGRGVLYQLVRRSTTNFEWGKFITFKFDDFSFQTLFYVVAKFSNIGKKMIKICNRKKNHISHITVFKL